MKDKKRMGYPMGGKTRSIYMGGGYGSKRNMMAKGGYAKDYGSIMEMEKGCKTPDHNPSMKNQ